MQEVIREEFTEKGHTVIAISHRLSTPPPGSSDAVVWINNGRVEKIGRRDEMVAFEAGSES
ncbi:hypothetical protein ONS96_005439 [Cadophora gregata f. sp. sojae]|nr:hypothetical protein ONS96_005439 [Cadophora gregata f. sp. sojae]